jgi:hypothetical protein
MSSRKALVLSGSPKLQDGTTQALADAVVKRLGHYGSDVSERNILASLRNDQQGLWADCASSDLIVLCFPLYVDSLPAPVVEWMEKLAAYLPTEKTETSFLAIGQCGNPDPDHINVAMEILQNFARRMGYRWVGGLSLGMGPVLAGKQLESAGRSSRHAVIGLQKALDALAHGQQVPEDAQSTFSKRPMPTFLFLMMANRMWKRVSKRHGAYAKLMDRPYGR